MDGARTSSPLCAINTLVKETEQQRDREVGVGWKERDGNSERGREGQKGEDGRHRKTQREKVRKRHGETAETHLKRIFRQSFLKARYQAQETVV